MMEILVLAHYKLRGWIEAIGRLFEGRPCNSETNRRNAFDILLRRHFRAKSHNLCWSCVCDFCRPRTKLPIVQVREAILVSETRRMPRYISFDFNGIIIQKVPFICLIKKKNRNA